MAWRGDGKKQLSVGIVGLGYVGLPLAIEFWRSGCHVIGFDIDTKKTESLNSGKTYIQRVDSETISEAVKSKRLEATTDFSRIGEADAVCICVPTPLHENDEPDLSYVLNTGKQIGPNLSAGQLVVLESTTYPGTTEDDLRPVLEKLSGLKAGADFHLAFSPEREDPGNQKFRTGNIPKVVGGMTPACLKAAVDLYSLVSPQVVPVNSTQAAEATKLLENIFRCVNIALVNELKVVFEKMDLNVWEIIEAAKTKPFGFMPFYPGPGLGGHCIPIDPFYLTWKAAQCGVDTRFIKLAGEVNRSMPPYVVAKLAAALAEQGETLNGSKILILGLAYKKDVDDPRESPSFVLWELLEKAGASVTFHDPYIPKAPHMREHPQFAGRMSVTLTAENLAAADAVLIATDHSNVDYALVARNARMLIDTRNACAKLPDELRAKVVQA